MHSVVGAIFGGFYIREVKTVFYIFCNFAFEKYIMEGVLHWFEGEGGRGVGRAELLLDS